MVGQEVRTSSEPNAFRNHGHSFIITKRGRGIMNTKMINQWEHSLLRASSSRGSIAPRAALPPKSNCTSHCSSLKVLWKLVLPFYESPPHTSTLPILASSAAGSIRKGPQMWGSGQGVLGNTRKILGQRRLIKARKKDDNVCVFLRISMS